MHTVERKVSICQRAYKLLTEDSGFDPSDIIFDPADELRLRLVAGEIRSK